MSGVVARLQEQFESGGESGTNYILTGKPNPTKSGRTSPRSLHSDYTGFYDDYGENQTLQSYLRKSGDFEDSGLSEEELKIFDHYDPTTKGQTFVMEKNKLKRNAHRPPSKEYIPSEYDVPQYPPKPKAWPRIKESPGDRRGRSPLPKPRSRSEDRSMDYDEYDRGKSLPLADVSKVDLRRTRSKSMSNAYDDSSETDSIISSRSRSPRQQVMRISDNESSNRNHRRVSDIIEALNSRQSSPETARRSSSPAKAPVPFPRTQTRNELGNDNWILKSQPQRPSTLDISEDTSFQPIGNPRKLGRQQFDEVDLGQPGISGFEGKRTRSPHHSRESSLDLQRPRSDSKSQNSEKQGKRISQTSTGLVNEDDPSHLYEQLSQAQTYKPTQNETQNPYEELPLRNLNAYRSRAMSSADSLAGWSNRHRSSSCVEADMYPMRKSSPAGSQISNHTTATNMNYDLTVAVQEDIDSDKYKQNDTCSNFYIIALKWIAAMLIAVVVLVCVTANKICLLVIGKEYQSLSSIAAATNVTNVSSADPRGGKEEGKKESVLIMLMIILMVPQATSLCGAIWSKRRSQPWPRLKAVLWIILGGILEAFCLSYLCLYAATELSKHPEVFLLFVSGLFLVPTIIQVYQSALRFREKKGQRRFALFIFAAALQVAGFTLLFLHKGMPNLRDKIGIPLAIGILSLAWSPKLRSLQTKAQELPSHPLSPRRAMSVEDISANDLEGNTPKQKSQTLASAASSLGTLDTPESLLKPSAREKAALLMSLVLLIVTPVACLVWIAVFELGDLDMFDAGFQQITTNHPVFYYFLIQLFATFLAYHAAWLACSMYAQQLAFALPLTLATPLALVFIEVKQLCGTSWIALPCGPTERESLYYLVGIAALLLLGQFLSTGYYVWANKGYIMGKASHLFWIPSYTGVLLEPFLLLNRRNKVTDDSHVSSKNLTRQTYVFICSTMYHEELYEMEQLLESIHDIDNNLKKGKRHVESHIFFDGSIKADVMNNYVLQLASIIKKTLKVELSQGKKIRTPYGMQLQFDLPGGLSVTIHMKDNFKVKNKKRWSQVMYMSYVLDYKQRLFNVSDDQTFILTTDADVHFTHESMEALIDYMVQDEAIGAVCGRTHPMGNGPLVWYQIFDYAVGHWFMKVANHVFGSVLCCPGCFSLYRCKAVRDVLREYSSNVNEAFEFLTKDMGEDRWFCTLMVQRGWRLAYCAAAEDSTYCPQDFEEFYKQRRRWMPSTLANLSLLVSRWRMVIGNNENISFAFILYQVILLLATLIGPSIVILFIVGGLVTLGDVNEDVLVILMSIVTIGYAMICLFFSQDIQIKIAKFMTFVFAIMMIMVTIGLCLQISKEVKDRKKARALAAASNGTVTLSLEQQLPAGVSTLYLAGLSGIFILAAFLHPKEILCLLNGIWYLLCLPSGYLLLTIYSVVNMTDRSWGTREGKNANTAIGQNENPLTTLWRLFKSKFACCFKHLCCLNKSKSESYKSKGDFARSISDKFRRRISKDNPKDREEHRGRGRRRQTSRADEESETSSIYSTKGRHSVKPGGKPRKKHSHGTITGRIHSVLTRNLSSRRERELAEEIDQMYGRRHPANSDEFGEIGRGMHDNRGFERHIRADNETPESALEGSSDPGYSSNTPPRPVKIPLRTNESGSRLLPIPSGDLDEPSSFYGETMSTLTTTVDDLLTEIYLDMPVEEWLKGDLRPYVDNFKTHGYDTIQFIGGMTEKDLEYIGIAIRGHRQKLKRVTDKLPRKVIEEGIPTDVRGWLLDLGLVEYWQFFMENSYTEPNDLEDLRRMDKEQLKTTFHVKKVAHINMLCQAIQKLQYANKGQKDIREARRQIDMLPMDTLQPKNEEDEALEYHFWEELRHECLMPELAGFDANTELKEKLAELRNSALMMFFVSNCLWMVIIMVLVKQASLKTLGVDVLGLSFLIVYGTVTFFQFLAMITHRLTTLLHVLARAPWTCCSRSKPNGHVREQVNPGYTQEPQCTIPNEHVTEQVNAGYSQDPQS